MELAFSKIEYLDVFTRDFSPFTRNNKITFPANEQIAVVYGPNGTGKTSLIKVLSDSSNTSVEFELEGVTYTQGASVFHVINDQNNRNIISGDTRDFFLGDNIRHEFELQDLLGEKRKSFISAVIALLKENGITAAKSPLLELMPNPDIKGFIKDCANGKSKGDKFTNEQIFDFFSSFLPTTSECDGDEDKIRFIVDDLAKKIPVVSLIEKLSTETVIPNAHVREIEENTEAISILSRFHKSQCIVCDAENIDWESLLSEKTENREAVKQMLDPKVKEILEQITDLQLSQDPFNLKPRLLETIETGNIQTIAEILVEIQECKQQYLARVEKALADAYIASGFESVYREYQQLIAETPTITDEDYLYIQEIIANSMSKPLTVERDENRRLRIRLSNQDFLGKGRDELPLSTGEQNFLSLTFEFLKAKNSSCPIVVIDDPVSSFDSIYKNKVVYAIVKILHHKKRIVLTHNTDLIRLLDGQYKHCFKLYLLNNTDGEMNGFIPLKNREQDMLISLEKLLDAFRSDVPTHVQNMEVYLISMIPFMRGYANIVNKQDVVENLTQVMHGYKTDTVDIAAVYIELFGNQSGTVPATLPVNVPMILSKTVDGTHLLDNTKFPLLDRTLQHSFQYLFLRLAVEKALTEKFNIDTTHHTQLGQIISAAFPDENDIEQIRSRIRLTSKKTLINEFNHFEGNLSIFQPAIDITDQALGKEKTDLMTFISNL